MINKMSKRLIIIASIIIYIGIIIVFFYSLQSHASLTQETNDNTSGSNVSASNSSQNNSAANKIVSIPLEKPPFIED